MKLRIKFAKSGVMRFIGQLDVMRYSQKALRRAEIDIAYTEGFSPHPVMSFAAPLGVGLESSGEYFDIEVCSYTTSADMKERLNQVMAPGMEVLSVTMLGDKVKNAMASVAAASYLVRFREGYEPDFDWIGQIKDFYSQPSIMVTKKTKKSEIELDLKPSIYQLSAKREENGETAVYMLVDASSAGNVKPSLVMDAFFKTIGRELPEYALQVTRTETYTDIGGGEGQELAPLEEVGEIF